MKSAVFLAALVLISNFSRAAGDEIRKFDFMNVEKNINPKQDFSKEAANEASDDDPDFLSIFKHFSNLESLSQDLPNPGLSEKIVKLLNLQINHELSASYIYLILSSRLKTLNFSKMSEFFEKSAKEERDHGKLIIDYMILRGNVDCIEFYKIDLTEKALNVLKSQTPVGALKLAITLEKRIYQQILNLVQFAKDDLHLTDLLEKFIDDGIKSISELTKLIQLYESVKDDAGIFVMF